MNWFKVEAYIGWDDDRTEDEVIAEIFNGVTKGNLISPTYFVSNLTITKPVYTADGQHQ